MAEVTNMPVSSSFADFNGSALDLRKRDRESPVLLQCVKKFKHCSEDDNQNQQPKLESPVSSRGSSSESPTSYYGSPLENLNSLCTRRNEQKLKVHAPIQWPLEATRGYSISSLVHAEQGRSGSPKDLHARYSEFFDYAKTKCSFSATNQDSELKYEPRRVLSRSPLEMPPAPDERSPSLGLVDVDVDVGVLHKSRSTSLSPNVIQPQSPMNERLLSPSQMSRPKSAENPSSYRIVDSLRVNDAEFRAAPTYSRTKGKHNQDYRSSPTSLPRADSSMSGKTSISSLDGSESSSEGLDIKSVITSSDLVDAKVESFTNSSGLYLDQVHPALSLTDKIITAGITGKPSRPFKAYPKDPLFMATSLAAVDPEEYRYSQQDYYDFRDKMLALTRSASGQSNPKMKRSGSPTNEGEEQEGSKDAQYWERRRKNNEAAKRSRDARKAKEDEIAIRAAYLENQNRLLSAEIKHLRFVTDQLRRLAQERLCAR